jgi:hypothetical protein
MKRRTFLFYWLRARPTFDQCIYKVLRTKTLFKVVYGTVFTFNHAGVAFDAKPLAEVFAQFRELQTARVPALI